MLLTSSAASIIIFLLAGLQWVQDIDDWPEKKFHFYIFFGSMNQSCEADKGLRGTSWNLVYCDGIQIGDGEVNTVFSYVRKV